MKNKVDENNLPVETPDAPPPILGTWNRLYVLVLVMHAVFIFLFYWFTKIYQ